MVKIKNNVLQKELTYDNTVVLKYHIEYPSIVTNSYLPGKERFNIYNRKQAMELRNKTENELYKEAIEVYKYNKENGYPIMVFEVYKTFNITYNIGKLISLYSDEYTYTGGAHGNTIRTSETWNLVYGRKLELSELYKNPYFIIDILKTINLQISENPENYFSNSCNLVLETFNPENFYLIDKNKIVIYFQQYDIAPYSSGIPVFEMKLE